MMYVVNAVLVKEISYEKQGLSITVPKGTQIKVDVKRQIALVDSDHVDIMDDEYKELYMN